MDNQTIASAFNGLAHKKRVEIFKSLLKQHPHPMLFGDISKCCSIAPSTLKHHLQELEAANIVKRKIIGRNTQLHLEIDNLEKILRGFLVDCCGGSSAKEK